MYGKLLEKLIEHSESGPYPFHMPGHKRISLGFPDPYSIDITEIEGFDDLHHPEGIIKELENRVARIYGAGSAILSVNGSTAGNLAVIHSAVPKGGKVIVSPERHRSVDHALMLLEAAEIPWSGEAGTVNEEISGSQNNNPADLTESIISDLDKADETPDAVIITSPGYNGECYDIKGLADVCHERNIPLVVDAAHGAHFGFHPFFPEHPIKLGADAVVTSLHKTLPAFTQTSVILIKEDSLISDSDIREWMDVFETSSPSYILMAGIERCMDYLENEGQQAFAEYAEKLERLYNAAPKWKALRLRDYSKFERLSKNRLAVDPGKLVLTADGMSPVELARVLRDEYKIEPERVTNEDVLLMTSVCDTDEAYEKLRTAGEMVSLDETVIEGFTRLKWEKYFV